MPLSPLRIGLSSCNRVAILKLCDPLSRNALSRTSVSKFNEALHWLNKSTAINACVVCSDVPGVFSSGADLKERLDFSTREVREFVSSLRTLACTIEDLPMPTVACVDGAALGGGLEMALACDLRVSMSHSKFGLPEVSLAVIPGAGGSQRLQRLIRPSLAKFMTFTGTKMDAATALEIGLVDFVIGKNHQTALPHFLQKQVELESLDAALETLKRVKEEKFGTIAFREVNTSIDPAEEQSSKSPEFPSR